MVISCAESVPTLAQHTPVLSADLEATGSGAVMAAKGLAAARQSGAGSRRTEVLRWDLRHLESDVATVAHDLGADLDQLFAQSGQRPVLNVFRQRQRSHEVAEVISERMELKPDGIVAEAVAR